jgi:hypothetical protein
MIPPFCLLWIFIAGFYIEGVVRRPFLKLQRTMKLKNTLYVSGAIYPMGIRAHSLGLTGHV